MEKDLAALSSTVEAAQDEYNNLTKRNHEEIDRLRVE